MQTKMKLFLAGELLSIVMIVALPAGPAISKANSSQADPASTELTDEALTAPLTRAVSEVKDPQTAALSQKLVQAYGLEDTASQSNVDDASGLVNLLPDVAKIHRTAMDMPLIEAGKQLKDKELSDFYQSFISSVGVGK